MIEPVDPSDPVEYFVDLIVPWQIQLGCLAAVVALIAIALFAAN